MRLRRRLRYCYYRLRRLQGDPRKIAGGMALGVFIGVTPTIPLHMLSALALAYLLGISRVAAVMGCWISNPLTVPFFYYLSFKIGKWLLFPQHSLSLPEGFDLLELLRLGWEVNLALQLGGLILAVPFGIAAYFFTLKVVQRYRRGVGTNNRALSVSQDSLPPSRVDAQQGQGAAFSAAPGTGPTPGSRLGSGTAGHGGGDRCGAGGADRFSGRGGSAGGGFGGGQPPG